MNKLKWLYPGLKFKRWLAIVLLGILLISTGVAVIIRFEPLSMLEDVFVSLIYSITGQLSSGINIFLGILIIGFGFYLVMFGIRKMISSVYDALLPGQEDGLVDILYQNRYLNRGPKIVVVGGGTGLSTMLRGIKKYTSNITAIVTVADDGGSSGVLRDELDILPPGDIRNCLVALANTEPLMENLFQYRFEEGELEGHSFGNLFIATLSKITGNFHQGVKKSSDVLAIRGQVLPSTLHDMRLYATLENGDTVKGESNIPETEGKIKKLSIDPADCEALPEALQAIKQADAVILGPGSLYTSVLPNLLIENLAEEIKKTEALKIYACNVMTQPGETDDYTASEHVQAIYNHIGEKIIDYVLVNDGEVEEELLEKYAEEGSYPVEVDWNQLLEQNLEIISEDLINQTDLVRHDHDKLAQVIMNLIFAEEQERN
ncbi:gluconeogenesis factor YvcK family protein [Halanaerobacter jeridensis]|uniref:Putative gluconeogenesis factor n=1 Tax=Halanaerobacter jeridensis TaxID=706427 RepID=A0A939BMK6_9FIRM|nr:gluconeogenesis factor YvcK family protein [Halanaerobacter jeridensis]MBM7556805.1 putative cofD-like protein [Halanaerobacter jeridensis]